MKTVTIAGMMMMMAMAVGCGSAAVSSSSEELLKAYMMPEDDDNPSFDSELTTIAEEVASWRGEQLDTTLISNISFTNKELRDSKEGYEAIAVCVRKSVIYLPYSRSMLFKRDAWNTLTLIQKYTLVAHELGHCQWNWTHDDTIEGDLMFQRLASFETLEDLHNAVIIGIEE